MDRVVSATEARIHFGEVMRQVVKTGEPVVVERGGKPHVVVVSVAEYERLLAGDDQRDLWRELVDGARDRVKGELDDRPLPPPEEMLRRIREERDARLLAVR